MRVAQYNAYNVDVIGTIWFTNYNVHVNMKMSATFLPLYRNRKQAKKWLSFKRLFENYGIPLCP